MFGDDFSEKFYVAESFLSRIFNHEPEPLFIIIDIKIDDRVDSRAKEGFENDLTDLFICVISHAAEALKVENFYRWIVLDNLSE